MGGRCLPVARSIIALLVAIALTNAGAPPVAAQAPSAPHLVLLSADIEERLPPGSEPLVVFRVRVNAPAPCAADRAAVSYTFLLDTDRTRTTGTVTRAFPEIGIERSVVIRCDPATGRFTSAAGPVVARQSVGPDPGWELALSVPRRVVPSQEFDWIVTAHEDTRYDRLPVSGQSMVWRIQDWQW
jgi:hypothetical protein